ncbi:tetratricopeptide repeat protein [Chryseobacterium rhizosphaerae]|jgi:tetratricopeptide (TPR) repeat protein|uniref:Tetratricopeptide repeat protein n=1 Tax=Chryseobacterium rhizosphaerae TaxID=395937 RepID=A0ABX9IJ70_9FLAO|nr:tetratricopeptide repeat protein [Chryseobacterium rhizosphaerae]REC74678.1 hypothetical protein DRF57_13055 [Chryseobacterium rhizosphaerae]GEN66280.1 hypothetical protein CRH01_08480 [Chryseobacterium rhizosphaerae]
MKNIKIYTLCIGLLLVLVSCGKNISEREKESFDTDLVFANHTYMSTWGYESAMRLNIEYLKKAEKMNYPEGKGICYHNIACINVTIGDYEKANFFFNKAREYIDISKNPLHKALFYHNYSRYYKFLNLTDKAIEYSNTAFYYMNKAKKSKLKDRILPRMYLNRGTYFMEKGWLGTSLKIFLKANELEDSKLTNSMLAKYYLSVHQPDIAETYLVKANEKMLSDKTDDVESFYVYSTMGEYYNTLNRNEDAEKAFKKALFILETQGVYSVFKGRCYKSLAELYKKMHDKDRAYYYLKKYTEEEGKSGSAQLTTLNKMMDDFMTETKKESDWNRSKLPLAIALAIGAITASGVYVRKIINTLRLKKRNLKKETDDLKKHMHTKQFQEVRDLVKRNDSSFLLKFKELYPDFTGALLKINPDLENSELAFCAMLKLRLSSKEIADYTFVQHKSVQQKKYRIRKRLNIPAEEDTYDFFDHLQ